MPWPSNRRIIGTKVQRLDGPDKATGRAKYSFDINRPGMLHARILRCPHAHARVTNIDMAAAERVPGYRAHYLIAQPNNRTELFFAGAEVVAIAADTEEHAEDVLRAIRVEYEILSFQVKETDALRNAMRTVPGGGTSNVQPGGQFATQNFDGQAYQNAVAVVEKTYAVPVICHQCLESHGLVAEWDAALEKLTVWASTQAVPGTAGGLANHFRIPAASVKCITHYMGGGFGSKFGPGAFGPQTTGEGLAAAELAKRARAPVKLMLDRAEEVAVGGMRPSAGGTVKIAAANNQGRVQAYEVDCYGTPGVGGGATVNFQGLPYVYTTIPNVKRRHRVVRLNTQTARAMRAPGHPQSCFLTEQAMDDLAARLNVNPLEMRLANLPADDPQARQNSPQSYNALRHTIYTREIEIARRLSEWDRKWHTPGQGGRGPIKHGIGMALHTWGGGGGPSNLVRVSIANDGSVAVQCSTQDLGTAARTVLAIVAAEVLGLEVRNVTVRVGESQYGPSTPSGGSTTTPGISPATLNAATAARTQLFAAIAPRLNAQPGDLTIDPARPGVVVNRTNNTTTPWAQACSHLQNPIEATGNWTGGLSNQGVGGVQIAEVRADAETGVVRCTRIVAVQDCGLIINKQGCESQVAGGVIMGVNYALLEERVMDRVTGRQCNPDMEFYKLGGIQDMPQIVVHMMDMPERGVIGIGEPPTISTCAAIANAVFNALGVRVGEAPFTPERVLAALASREGGTR
jgi:xanthine dehydrogenase YagR molybdenum-binding subunit